MVRGPKNKLGNRIAATILVVALLPILLSTIGTLSTIHDITDAAVLEGQRQVTLAVESVQKNSLENQTKLVNAELSKIENSVSYLATVSQQVLSHPELFKPLKDATALKKEADGYEWTPISSNKNLTTVFIGKGARLSSGSLADIGRTKYLEPLFVNALAQDSHAVAAYIILRESITRIYPQLDFHTMIAKGWFPAEFDPYQFNFFYTADPTHDPARKVVWTAPYLDVTGRGWMVTSLMPIYLENGQFRGIVGVDVTLQNLVKGILDDIHFQQPGAYAFLLRSDGQVIAAQPKGYSSLDISGTKSANLLQLGNQQLSAAARQIGAGGSGLLTVDLHGLKQYLFYAPLGVNGWSMVFAVPVAEVVNPIEDTIQANTRKQVQTLELRAITTSLLALVLVVILAVLFSYRVTRPIRQLMAAVGTLGNGDNGVQIPVTQKDEIGLLVLTFNEMSARMKNLVENLEAKVRERTSLLRKALERQKEVNRKILASERARRTLIASVSHELRTPISAIQGYTEALRDGIVKDPQEVANYLEIIYRRVIGLNILIDDLFCLSRLEAHLPMDIQTYGATPLLTQFAGALKTELEVAKLSLEVEIQANLPGICVDKERLNQVVVNLVTNAIKFTPAGGKISFRAYAAENVMVEVSDTGIGIAPEDLTHIFERFYRGKRNPLRRTRGHGLGLTIVKEIIEAMGGQIWVFSQPGQGCTFTFSLPVEPAGHENKLSEN